MYKNESVNIHYIVELDIFCRSICHKDIDLFNIKFLYLSHSAACINFCYYERFRLSLLLFYTVLLFVRLLDYLKVYTSSSEAENNSGSCFGFRATLQVTGTSFICYVPQIIVMYPNIQCFFVMRHQNIVMCWHITKKNGRITKKKRGYP